MATAEVEMAKERCKGVIERIQRLPASLNISNSSRRTLLKLAQSELDFLSRCSSSSGPPSMNIGHLEAVVHILEQPLITAVSRVCKPLPLVSHAVRNAEKGNCSSSFKGVYVDVVCTLNKRPVWIIVSDRKPRYISWYKSHKTRGLKARLEALLDAARSSQALKPCSIILFFSNGLSSFIAERLKEEFNATGFSFGISDSDFDFSENLEDDWVGVVPKPYREEAAFEVKVNNFVPVDLASECNVEENCRGAGGLGFREILPERELGDAFCSILQEIKRCPFELESVNSSNLEDMLGRDDDLINFDTTALIALVSGISNGSTEKLLATPECDLRQRFKGNYDFVIGQVMSEMQKPILDELGVIISGKRCIICNSVCSEFKDLVLMCGGPKEKLRADRLLECLIVVPDRPSERMMSLPTTRKLALKNKIVFGTGDFWRAPTLTANMSFVRAISQTGMSLCAIEHRPRALTGD